jgi:hypothetical protein
MEEEEEEENGGRRKEEEEEDEEEDDEDCFNVENTYVFCYVSCTNKHKTCGCHASQR